MVKLSAYARRTVATVVIALVTTLGMSAPGQNPALGASPRMPQDGLSSLGTGSGDTSQFTSVDLVAQAAASGGIQSYSRRAASTTAEEASTDQYADQVDAFWTDERLDSAEPEHQVQIPPDAIEEFSAADPTTAAPPGSEPTAAEVATPDGVYNAPTGKYFYTRPNGNLKWCTASVVNTSSRRIAITAGHCVHTGKDGTWMHAGEFFPAYNDGTKPFGGFPVTKMVTFSDWANYGGREWNARTSIGFNRDVGVLVLANGRRINKRVQTVTGGHGWMYNTDRSNFWVDVFGYPANLQQGRVRQRCSAGTASSQYEHLKVACNFEGGSSGGPWLYNMSGGYGYVRGITSIFFSDSFNFGRTTIATPRIDTAVTNMINSANNGAQ